MRKLQFDKSHILLWLIAALFLTALVAGIVVLRSESLSSQLRTDQPVNVLLIFQQDGKPASTQLLTFYPSKAKAALLDIPGNTAVILTTIKRMDRIDYTYKANNPKSFTTEVSRYLDIPLNGYLLFDEKGLSSIVDYLDGLQLFIPSMIIQDGEASVRLPGGAVTLDGEKVLQFLRYKEDQENEGDALARRQKMTLALIKRLAYRSEYLENTKTAAMLTKPIESNFSGQAQRRLLQEIAKLDADSILMQRITGTYRAVEDDELFFPFYDGELARDMLKQTLNAMSVSNSAGSGGRIYTVEILNGTTERGLAARTAEIFGSFGYDVVAVGNADQTEYASTRIIDRYGDKEALSSIGAVIKCANFGDASEYKGSIKADYTIILGRDFDGRVCVQ
jgi:anionic cell wall polymer biosynthesis LytR-Cps2A-Psr (LCP) family protein